MARPDYVLDTNVVLDSITRGDLYRVIARWLPQRRVPPDADPNPLGLGDSVFSDPELSMRLLRAQTGWALMQFFHSRRIKTYSYAPELIRSSLKMTGADRYSEAEVVHFTYVLADRLLWNWGFGSDPEDPQDLKSTNVDKHLVHRAQEFGVPIITNEGLRVDGQVDETAFLRRYARESGVPIVTSMQMLIDAGADARLLARALTLRFVAHSMLEPPEFPLRAFPPLRPAVARVREFWTMSSIFIEPTSHAPG